MSVIKTYYPRGKHAVDERGEGVISAAIAVLVMAFIGVAMWIAFDATFKTASTHVNQQVNCIGQSNASC
jgi:hypothetical protein